MTPFVAFTGVAAPLPLANVNTDAIIPSAYLRSLHADLARGLFAGWRFDDDGRERPGFVLNRAPFRSAQILLAGPNFGCGSSREAAVWALARFGIRAVFAPSFADIFYENAFRNGLLAAVIDPEALGQATAAVETDPANARFTVDLEAGRLVGPRGEEWRFHVPPSRRDALLRGDDEIALTLRYDRDISAFEVADAARRRWCYEPIDRLRRRA